MVSTKEATTEESSAAKAANALMNSLLAKTPLPPAEGEIVEGAVIAKEKTSVYVDLGMYGTGIIYGREFLNARDIIKKTKIGDVISAKVTEQENEDGYVELSLREAKDAAAWHEAEIAMKEKQPLRVSVENANKGGLMLKWHGVSGFLPASQLKPEHYPRVEDGDKIKIEEELKKFIGAEFEVTIIAADPEEGKLIFSERALTSPEKEKMVAQYQVGDTVEGEVTGAVDFGVFLKIEEGLEGLVHISEIDWGLIENPKEVFSIGEQVRAKIIEIKDDKISLSIKTLKENPWESVKDAYKVGDTVKGVVIKFNRYGALVSIKEGVAGLIHISGFGSIEELQKKLELGKTYDFKITLFDPKNQRMTLSLPHSQHEEEKPREEKPKEEEAKAEESAHTETE